MPCKPPKSQSGTGKIEQIWTDADLTGVGSIKQWEEPELIRAIAERDAESETLNKIKETGR